MIEIKNSNIEQISRNYADSVLMMKRHIKRDNNLSFAAFCTKKS